MPVSYGRVPREAMVGDPFFGAIIKAYGAVSKGVHAIQAARSARHVQPPQATSMLLDAGRYIPPAPRAGSGTGHRAPYAGSVTASARALPPGARMQSFPAGVGAYRRRYRRMNVLNLHALKRAIRRAKGFEHIARQVLTIPHHFKKHIKARGGPRRRR